MRFVLLIVLSALSLAVCAEPTVSVVRVLKSERKLQLWAGPQLLHEFPVALGSSPLGHKQQEGDGKTPEGRYVLDYRKADSAFYKALHVSYPNAQDLAAARARGVNLLGGVVQVVHLGRPARGVNPGGLIMIHGQKNGLGWLAFLSQRFDWTQGCIALRNEHMDILWRLTPLGTPVDIRP